MKEKLKDRYVIFAIFFITFGIIIIMSLVNLQIIHGKAYDEESQRRLLTEKKVAAPRGNIVDRNGIPIAVNRESNTVNIQYVSMSTAQRNEMFLKLVNIFEKNGDNYKKSLSNYITFNPIGYGPALKDEKSIEKWKREMALRDSDIELMTDPEAIFNYLRTKKFNIDEKYTDEEAYRIMCLRYEILIYQYTNCNPIASDVSRQTVAEIEERHSEFPGVTTDVEYKRQYIDGEAIAHVLGYVGAIPEEKLPELKKQGYNMNDIIGITGVEYAAEKYLKGKDGIRQIEQSINGKINTQLKLSSSNVMQPGSDVMLTIDMKLQKAAMESLEMRINEIRYKGGTNNYGDARAGAAVVIDVKTGEVLALASYPTFDPSAFLAGANDKEAQKLISEWINDTTGLIPMFNRAIQGTYAPGSTFKPLTAIAGLEEGVITKDTVFYDGGTWTLPPQDGGKTFTCLEYRTLGWAHGPLTLQRAITTSCNLYFYWLGYNTGIDTLNKWARIFGLGEKTGIDIPGEYKGVLASRESQRQYRNDIWRPADTCIAAIGQHDNMFTPIQLANYVSTIANEGKKFTPYVIKKIIKYDGTILEEKQPSYEELPVNPETFQIVKAGMVDVAASWEGTAAEAFQGFKYTVAGKTGTAETSEPNHSSNALFVCYAPAENPQVAVAVVVERGAWGSNAAFVARDVLDVYFGLAEETQKDDKIIPDEVAYTK